jgi:hypothetical protein|tara:strand:+ start:299 stop:592 length:294 start_codon:yes stop_codon:yes gene_type:complete
MNESRNSFGVIKVRHKGQTILTSVGSRKYEDTFCGLNSARNFPNKIGSIPAGYAHRPELISNLFLDTPGSWWLICERNNIFDIFEQLKLSDRVYIPI